jgi:hypothetical protein
MRIFSFGVHFDTCHTRRTSTNVTASLPYLQSRTLVTGLLTELAEDQPLG